MSKSNYIVLLNNTVKIQCKMPIHNMNITNLSTLCTITNTCRGRQGLSCFLISFLSKYALDGHLWPLRLTAFFNVSPVALLHSSGLWLCNWILLCASRVYKSKKFWLASNVSLVECESCAPLIVLVGQIHPDKTVQKVFKQKRWCVEHPVLMMQVLQLWQLRRPFFVKNFRSLMKSV